ncbi:alkaline phosphatase [Geosporobacter ferrireducens]|uniref:Alkaline phosphatase n=1 Tax=Geosporobacter ferrireducens TaxID=1424294 RepID=A0A1D8GHQ5_9FIRM|nr:alkaline phosphatase [Geosporobacter ferrireducens]AOT70432.1 alkaline phosphatase [Geosporobacter ferrireducens]
MLNNKKRLSLLLVVLLLIMTLSTVGVQANEKAEIKNVILLIPDGMNITSTTLARWYNGGGPLAMDEMACGLIRTYSADAAIADSAPAGTAMATGFKSHTGFISVLPDVADMPGQKPIAAGDERKPVATVLEAAKLAGKATGIVATSNIQHATPADFTAHYPDRNKYEILGEQQVYAEIDVVLGGGKKYLVKEGRSDQEDMIAEIKRLGYDYVTTPTELADAKGNKLWGMFADDAMSYDFDRDPEKEPSLAEMTEKAIEVLSKKQKGFFLMVEGSKIDWANHANDPIGTISDVLAFDQAVKVALDFAKENKETIVIVAPDHGTGGLSIGNWDTNKNYDNLPLSTFIDPLKKAKLTGEGVESKLNADKSNVVEVMKEYYGIDDLTEEEITAIQAAAKTKLNYAVGKMISKRAFLGWTTEGHTGEEVALYVYSPNRERLTGVVENTDIAKYIESVLKLNLKESNEKLFIAAQAAFKAKGATVSLDESDKENPVLTVTKDKIELKFPAFKNIVIKNGQSIKMKGLTIFNGEVFYVPKEAVDMIQ